MNKLRMGWMTFVSKILCIIIDTLLNVKHGSISFSFTMYLALIKFIIIDCCIAFNGSKLTC